MIADFASRARSLLVAAMLLFAAAAAGQDTWKWTIETVDSSPSKFSWLAVDEQGNVHASYASDEGIKYAFRSAGQQKWFTMLVEVTAGFTRIAVDKKGVPSICFTNGSTRYAVLEQHRWVVQEIAPRSGDRNYSCGIGIGPDGGPQVSWYHLTTGDGSGFLHFKHAFLKDGVWYARTVDLEPQTGKWNALAVDQNGNAHISYDSFVLGKAKYAFFNGREWTISTIDERTAKSGYNPGVGNSIAVGTDGTPHIAYEDAQSLKYAHLQGKRWKIEKIESISPSGSWQGYRTSIALDSKGRPHVCYDDGGVVKHAYRDDEGWHVQTVVRSGTEIWRYCSIVCDKKDTLFISFRDPVDGSLKVAVGHLSSADPPKAR